ncbi:MAG TPA: cyanophycinase [Methylomirabilota bacterium]|nr:cyanophycinase [Methylomirabilota bacterium]
MTHASHRHRSRFFPWLAVPLVVLIVVVGASTCSADEPPRGHLVLNGGGSKPREVMEKFVELAGGPDAAIVVVPTASGEPDTGQYYVDLFTDEYGCSNVFVADVKTAQDAQDPVLAARVLAAGGIFFSGGDQRRITEALIGTPVGSAVREAFERGAAVGGTSAGTACQSPLMITGDGDFTVLAADNVELWEGLGLFPGVIVDQHFVARSRHNRLMAVVLEHPELLGVGVDEATAVWVRPDGTFQVLGEGWVVVYDARGAEVHRREGPGGRSDLGVHSMRTHILLPGEIFDVNRREPVVRVRDGGRR